MKRPVNKSIVKNTYKREGREKGGKRKDPSYPRSRGSRVFCENFALALRPEVQV